MRETTTSWTRRELLGALATGWAAPFLLNGCIPDGGPLARAVAPGKMPSKTPGAAAQQAAMPLVDAIALRPSAERGGADHGWLLAKHSFSFSRYQDPRHMGFRALRVLNEDVVQPGQGFPMHPHRDMEIITYILDGALEHKDSEGNGGIIKPGEVQQMTAGSGIWHSEFNPSGSAPVHLLQIWLKPDQHGYQPRYQQKVIPRASIQQPLRLIASPDGADGSVAIYQDARIHACQLIRGQSMAFEVRPTRHAWLQVARGQLELNGKTLAQGDGASTSQTGWLKLDASSDAELLIFDLA
jgi:quercetin 2,3-dioxygenase